MLLSSASFEDAPLVWTLRICVAMTFFGHGYLATQTQQSWLAYLRVAGIGSRWGYILMPLIGYLDILLAVLCVFVYPLPSVHAWCGLWGLATALMRPLAGESIHQFIERSGNFLPAFVLVYLETKSELKPEYSFEQWMLVTAIVSAAGVGVCIFLRITGLLAAERPKKA